VRPTGLGVKAALFYLLLVTAFFAAPYANLFFLQRYGLARDEAGWDRLLKQLFSSERYRPLAVRENERGR
jgi:hypothetical protein